MLRSVDITIVVFAVLGIGTNFEASVAVSFNVGKREKNNF